MVVAEVAQELHLLLAGPGQERPQETVLGPEEEEQHAWAGPDDAGQWAQREVGHAMEAHIRVRRLEQLRLAGRGRCVRLGHAAILALKQSVQ